MTALLEIEESEDGKEYLFYSAVRYVDQIEEQLQAPAPNDVEMLDGAAATGPRRSS